MSRDAPTPSGKTGAATIADEIGQHRARIEKYITVANEAYWKASEPELTEALEKIKKLNREIQRLARIEDCDDGAKPSNASPFNEEPRRSPCLARRISRE